MSFEEVVAICREKYPEFNFHDDVDLLCEVQDRWIKKLDRDDLTPEESKFINDVLPHINYYLTF